MADPKGAGEADPAGDALERVLLECLDRLEREGETALDAVCREHPEHAEAVRRKISRLRDMGLVGQGDAARSLGAGELPVPKRMGEFRLLEVLGGGGMGIVYLAEQESLGRRVAVKLIRPEHLYFPGARERFRREVEIVGRLQHPGVVPIHTVGEEGEIPYFVMERVHGCTLDAALREVALLGRAEELSGTDLARAIRSATPAGGAEEDDEDATGSALGYVFSGTYEEACLRIVRQVAEALEHAHRRGVLHRDVKPSNVMVTPSGRAMLVDFGLSCAEGAGRLTRSGTPMGSLFTMSPEQARGEFQQLDARSDVYSLGVTLYEMLALVPPFTGDSAPEILLRIQEGGAEPVRRRNPSVSWEAETVCLTAMEVDRERRYATAADLARDLGNVLDKRPIEARRASVLLRARRWAERHPATAVGAVLAAVVLIGGPTFYALLERGARQRIEEKSRLADENFRRAADAVDRMLTRVGSETLQYVPRMEPVRAALLEDAVEFYDGLLEAQSDDPATRRAAARARLRVGSLLGDLGRSDEAIVALEEAVERFRALADTSQAVDRRDLAEALLALAKQSVEIGADDAAERAARAAWERLDEIAGPDEGPAVGRDRARALALLAAIEARRSEVTPADEDYRRAILELERHEERWPDDAGAGQELARVCMEYGLFLFRLAPERDELIDPAIEHLRRAVTLFSRQVEESPQDPDLTLLLCSARNNLSSALRRKGAREEALEGYRANVRPLEEIAERFPESYRFRWELATAWNNIGVTLEMMARGDEARPALERSRDVLTEVVAQFPEQVEVRSNLATLLHNLAVRRLREGDVAGAAALVEEALPVSEGVVKLSPRNPQFVMQLRGLLLLKAEVFAALGRDDEALALLAAHRQTAPERWETCTEAIGAVARSLESATSARGEDVPAERYAALAAELGEAALSLGFPYPHEFRTMGFLAPLREVEPFKTFVARQEPPDESSP